SMPHFDLIVIGSGPAGEKGAVQAAYFGKRVLLVERAAELGGAGINTGTIPSKTLRETALYYSGLRQRGLYGLDYSLKDEMTVADFMFRKDHVVANERALVSRNLERHGVQVVHGVASLDAPGAVRIRTSAGGDECHTADVILIATGSSPHRPSEIPFDGCVIHDSDTILAMDRVPRRMVVVGGGVIGSEYASIFTALGVEVTLIEGRDRLLPFVDAEIADRLRHRLEGFGLRFIFNGRVETVAVRDGRAALTLAGGETLDADIALFAAGRQSNIEGLGLEGLGVRLGKRGLILVDDHYATNVPGICAAGDVIGFPALASTSMEQARVAMVHAFSLAYKERMSPVIPLAVYTVPELAQAGLTEEECQAGGIDRVVGRSWYDKSPRGQIIGDLAGMLKLIFAPGDKRLLGVHVIGEMASELVHLGAQVLAQQGTIDAFIDAVYNYPSLTDSYKYAAYDGLGALARRASRDTGADAT
ncbi:MAG TPA: Si-specific NAD(P)(+) transhydrogenase, partial [Gemmatimonadales bacterium]|nr:Si-specific NAD(P)(+) transhydrogenase [Gemmatimonadales bacterium]